MFRSLYAWLITCTASGAAPGVTGDRSLRSVMAALAVPTFCVHRIKREDSSLGHHDRLLKILLRWLSWAAAFMHLRRTTSRQVLPVVVFGAVSPGRAANGCFGRRGVRRGRDRPEGG